MENHFTIAAINRYFFFKKELPELTQNLKHSTKRKRKKIQNLKNILKKSGEN